MKRWGCAGAVAAAWIAGCGTSNPTVSPEVTGVTSSAIQGGQTDSAHLFAVGVVQINQSTVEFCSGSLLAPNLVATARHCVAAISSPEIDCSQATFGALVPTSSLFVTNATTIPDHGGSFAGVVAGGIYVPSESKVCGDDIALLVLDQSFNLPGGYPDGYVVPAINPPLTDPSRSTTIAAIGYGIDTPTDDGGVTAGTRRIKENVSLSCIPNDPNFTDCFSTPQLKNYLTAAEFISGDETTCEGDSGSGVYDQTQFDAGKWVSYGVLSRGSVSADGLDCVDPIYTRFDAWGPLLSQAAAAAATIGGYALPSWATGVSVSSDGSVTPSSDSSQAAGDDASAAQPTVGSNGTVCGSSSECDSGNCVSADQVHFYCAVSCGAGNSCDPAFVCEGPAGGNYCFPAASTSQSASGSGHSTGGCSVGRGLAESGHSGDPNGTLWMLGGVAVVVFGRGGRRRARKTRSLSGS
jgi:hypothetical protein